MAGIRSANYQITDVGTYEVADRAIRSETVLVDLVDDVVASSRPLTIRTRRNPSSFPVQGWEDVRLFVRDGELHGLATVRDVDESGICRIALLVSSGDYAVDEVLVDSPRPGRHEKNWAPWPHDDAVRAVYSWDPLRIVTIDPETGASSLIERGPSGLGPATRGGTGGCELDDGRWLFITHESHLTAAGRIYLHRFVAISPGGIVDCASARFRLMSTGVEFAAGCIRDEDDVVITFGVADREAWLARLSVEDALALLHPLHAPPGGMS